MKKRKSSPSIDISINRDTGVSRAIYVMNSGIFNSETRGGKQAARIEPAASNDITVSQTAAECAAATFGILALRGSGRGLWTPDAVSAVRALRDEW
jgi:hypothetical protein